MTGIYFIAATFVLIIFINIIYYGVMKKPLQKNNNYNGIVDKVNKEKTVAHSRPESPYNYYNIKDHT